MTDSEGMGRSIPKDWELHKLIDACVNITDGSHFSPKEDKNGQYRIATVANIKNNQFDIGSCKKISKVDFDTLVKNGCKADIGDVLFTKDGTVGLSFVFKQNMDIVLLSSIAIIKPKESLDPEFCAYALKSPIVFQKIVGSKRGTGLKRIILKDLKTIWIPIPSINEQKTIASMLSTIDNTIQKSDELITKTEKLKKGLMKKLLIKGIGHKQYKTTTLGEIPETWQIVKLIELSDLITKGTTPTSFGFNYTQSGINFLKVESIDEHGNFIFDKIAHIDERTNQALSRSILKENDILFSIAGALGSVAIVNKEILPANTNQALAIIRLKKNDKILLEFLKYYLMSPVIQTFIKTISIQSAQANLNLPHIRDFLIVIPPVEEQLKIVNILLITDKKLQLERKRKEKFEIIKKGLMNDLLTGKKRVRGFENV